jgi:hypothetical protein
MAAIYAVVVVVGVALLMVIALILVATIGIRREERHWTLLHEKAPGLAASVARRVNGVYIKKTEAESPPDVDPGKPFPWYERCG